MKVLLLAPQPFYQPRGTPIAVRMLAQSLANAGHEVDLLVFNEGEDVEMPGVRLIRSPRIPFMGGVRPGFSIKKLFHDAGMFLRVVGLRFGKRYDVIHAVEESVFMALVVGFLSRTPYLYDMDSSLAAQMDEKLGLPRFIRRVFDGFEAVAIRRSVGVVAVCKALEEIARRVAPKVPILRLEDVSLLDHDATGDDLRVLLEIDGPIVLYVGNLERYQGIDLLLEAFAIASDEHPTLSLVIIGGIPEHIAAYDAKAEALGVGGRTHLVGPRPIEDLAAYLRQADILASPRCLGGNTPMKLYSYMDSGVVVLATDLDTHTQVLDDDTAMLAAAEPAAFAAGLATLAGDGALRSRLSEAAGRRVAERYSAAAFDQKLSGFYADVEDRIAS